VRPSQREALRLETYKNETPAPEAPVCGRVRCKFQLSVISHTTPLPLAPPCFVVP
jgi:hypothetical protein